jgi:hypothetical protein
MGGKEKNGMGRRG